MFILEGKYTKATIYTDNIDNECISQIYSFLNNAAFKDLKIRIMPDCHAGKGAVIGFTSNIKDKVIPNVVGVDIGCGMYVIKIQEKDIDLPKLDEIIKNNIPSGTNIRKYTHRYAKRINIDRLNCLSHIDYTRATHSIGTLGGGNHFIESNKDSEGNIYIVVHSGSRYLGKQVATYYQDLAFKTMTNERNNELKAKIIEEYKAEGKQKEIEKALKNNTPQKVSKDLAYLEGYYLQQYLEDISIVQEYASINRQAIIDTIVEKMNLTVIDSFETIHNYIDLDNKIIRKGSISAQKGEKVIIPISRKDGSIIAIGKGNKDWNYSAPHGAGRIMSRSEAKEKLNLEDDIEDMKGIYSTTVTNSTLDESARAYKPIEEILNNITDTVEVQEVITPIYSFKNCN